MNREQAFIPEDIAHQWGADLSHREQAWMAYEAKHLPDEVAGWEETDAARLHWMGGYNAALTIAAELAAALEDIVYQADHIGHDCVVAKAIVSYGAKQLDAYRAATQQEAPTP